MLDKDDYTDEEIRRAVHLASFGMSSAQIWMQLGRHTPDSIYLMLMQISGVIEKSAPKYLLIAEELDANPYYSGWREDIVSRKNRIQSR